MSGMKRKTGILLFLLLMIIYAGTGLALMETGVAPVVAVSVAVVVFWGGGRVLVLAVDKPPPGSRSESEYGFNTTDEHSFTADFNKNSMIVIFCIR